MKEYIYALTAVVCLTQVFTKSGLLEASEGRSDVGLVVGVDENCAGIEPFTDIQCFADVPCENTRCQAILCSIGPPQDVIHFTEFRKMEEAHRTNTTVKRRKVSLMLGI